MIDFSEVFTFTDQPVTCPKCGARTEFTLDLIETIEQTQYHHCLSAKCMFEFVVQNDNLE